VEACQAHHCVLVTASPGAPLKPSEHIFRACLHFSGSARSSCGPHWQLASVAPLSCALPPLLLPCQFLPSAVSMCNVHTSPPGTLPHRIHGYHSRCTAVSTRPTPLPPAMVAEPTTGFGNQGHARKKWLRSTRHTVLPRPSRQCCGHIHPKWGSAASRGGQIRVWRRRCCQWCARRPDAVWPSALLGALNGQHDGGCCCCAT
jgi:hypothetical protein